MLLRAATAADLPTLIALVHGAFAEYRGRLDPPSGAEDETEASLRRALERGGATVAWIDDTPVGCVFYHRDRDFLYFGRLAVLPAYRRRGIAEALTAHVEERARVWRLPRVQLGVRLQLPSLQRYYERLGYEVVRRERHPGYAAPTYAVMEKVLTR